MATTSIKVSAELRDRINREAEASGVTAAGFIEVLLDGYERRQRSTTLLHRCRLTCGPDR